MSITKIITVLKNSLVVTWLYCMLKCVQFCRWMKHLDTGVPTGTSLNRMYKYNIKFSLVLLQIFTASKYNSPAQCWKWKLGIRGNYYSQQYD